jgi:predicted RND superfamily exporter protein
MALISVSAVPGVLAGVATFLYLTNTTLNIESFMGAIMSLGVSVSNSVLLVAFMNDHWQSGASTNEAATDGAEERLRPILMTACAMIIGMVPMSLALERGSQMQAPLGLAVIGGLVMSTVATLLVIPSIFAIVIGDRKARSPSLHSGDHDSKYYDPDALAESDEPGKADSEKDESDDDDSAKGGSRRSESEKGGYQRDDDSGAAGSGKDR